MNKNNRIYRSLAAAKREFFKNKSVSTQESPKKVDVQYIDDSEKRMFKVNIPKTIFDMKQEYCTGCGACAASCPQKAIFMQATNEGFLYPQINEGVCTKCTICTKICPVINRTSDNLSSPECYAVLADDEIRMQSSSGGMFSLLATYVINQGGVIVGAAFDEDFHVEHICVDNKEDLKKLRGSKYVQSNILNSFDKVKTLLQEDKYVLFTGCPCQVAAIKAFCGENQEKLFTMDIVCHGVPSPSVFEKYLEENNLNRDISEIRFRSKKSGYNCLYMEIIDVNGNSSFRTIDFDYYEKCFHESIILREACYECKFSEIPRQGDITAGDFWGISQYDATLNDQKGTSLVLANNSKGEFLIKKVKNIKRLENIPIDIALRNNRFKSKIYKPEKKRDIFFEMFPYAGFQKSAKYAIKEKYDVAIMGVWSGCNYGSVATYYALHSLITSLGLTVLMIDKLIVRNNDVEQGKTHSRRFAEEHYQISPKYHLKDTRLLNNFADTFVMGCDQVWNRGVNKPFGMSYYFDFVDEEKKKISYAASFGHADDFANGADRVTIKKYFERFDAISVREADGVKICKEIYDIKATQVLDPVFVCDVQKFIELTEKSMLASVKKNTEKYIVAYILDPTEEKNKAIQWISSMLGYKVVVLLNGEFWHFEDDSKKMKGIGEIPENLQVEDWLYYIKNCEYLITDSCHGVSFGIIFQKNFVGISNKRRGSSRFESLANLFGVNERIVSDPSQIIQNETLLENVDYNIINQILEREKVRSKMWLETALFAPKKVKTYCAYSLCMESMKDVENEQ